MRHNFLPHFTAAVLAALLTPLVFDIRGLDFNGAGQPIEMLLCLTGAVLLVPVFRPEQEEGIRDCVRARSVSHSLVCFIRTVYSLSAMALLVGIFVLVMKYLGSDVTLVHFGEGVGTAFFVGAVGFAFAGISNSTAAGYMGALVYYLGNIGLRDKLGGFYLFSLYTGGREVNRLLYFGGAVLIGVTLGIRHIREMR